MTLCDFDSYGHPVQSISSTAYGLRVESNVSMYFYFTFGGIG